MKVIVLVLVFLIIIAALFAIASGVWVVIALVRAISKHREIRKSGNQKDKLTIKERNHNVADGWF